MHMPDPAPLFHVLGFSSGIVLYAMLLVMVAGVRPRRPQTVATDRRRTDQPDRLLFVLAIAGLLWNAGALWLYGFRDLGAGAPSWLELISFSALGVLPAIAVHAVLRRGPSDQLSGAPLVLTIAGYGLSAAAAALQAFAVWTGSTVPNVVALRLLMAGFLLIMGPLAVMTRQQPSARRMLWIVAFAVFAISALHLSEHQLHDRWFMELAGHHGSLLLAFAVLYQDYPFALADLFLKRALAALVLLLTVAGVWWFLGPMVTGPEARPLGTPLLLGAWLATILLFPAVNRAASRIVDHLLLRGFDNNSTLAALAHDTGQQTDESAVLDGACRVLAPALSALSVTWRVSTEGEGVIPRSGVASVDARRLSATLTVPTTEPPRYVLNVSDVSGGRRLLSDEVVLLEHSAHIVARRVDAIRLERERFESRVREEEISRLAAEARLQALRTQINPHFLFNALTTIGYLVQTAPADAVRTLLRLTEVLRHVLKSDARVAPLRQELNVVKAYLEIEQARFEERLQTHIDVPADLEGVLVPPLILQPLVENAVKHGVSPSAAGGSVRVTARRIALQDGRLALALEVQDEATGTERMATSIESSGIGLSNIERRLALAYGDDASLMIEPSEHGTTARITLPLEISETRTTGRASRVAR
jgi:two-component sensor histidine kinase